MLILYRTVFEGAPSSPPLRIARIIARLNVGGAARHVVWLTEAFNNSDFESVLITGTVAAGEDDMTQFAADHGVYPIFFKEMSREISLSDLLTVWRLWRFFLRYRPDIVETHTAKAGAVGRAAGLLYEYLNWRQLLGRRRRCCFIHTYHGHVFHSYYGRVKTWLFLTIERLLAKITDAIVVVSNQQRREIHERFRVGRSSQIRIIPYGLDLDAFVGSESAGQQLRSALNIKQSDTVVGIVGRLTSIKNHELFLQVAARMNAGSRDGKVRFVIYGDGEDRQILTRRAAELSVGHRAIFAGTQEASSIYSSLDIAALTSRNEGMPLALIEAMANGKPVISTAVGGVVDLLGSVRSRVRTDEGEYEIRERGITVASGDAASFTVGLVRLIEDDTLRREIAPAGRDHVRASYSRDRLVNDMIGLYRELLSR